MVRSTNTWCTPSAHAGSASANSTDSKRCFPRHATRNPHGQLVRRRGTNHERSIAGFFALVVGLFSISDRFAGRSVDRPSASYSTRQPHNCPLVGGRGAATVGVVMRAAKLVGRAYGLRTF